MDEIPIPTNETTPDDNNPSNYTTADGIIDGVNFLVTQVNLLIIFVIFINKLLHTRTYWVIFNWSINTICFQMLILFRPTLLHMFSTCSLVYIDYLFPINSTLLMQMLIFDKLLDGKHSLKIILGATYASTFVLLTGFTLLCVLIESVMPSFLVFIVVSFMLFITVVVKETENCRKIKTTPPSAKRTFRLNLARIFIYNFMIVVFMYIVFDKPLQSTLGSLACMISYLLTPVYEFVYIMVADKNFKTATFNIFKSASKWKKLDAEFNLTDDE